MCQFRARLNTFCFIFHKRNHIFFNALIVGFDSLFEIVGAIFIYEVCDYGDGLLGFHFCRNLGIINYYLYMEYLLVNTFIEVIGYCTFKHTLTRCGIKAEFTKSFEKKTCIYQGLLRNSHISCVYGLLNLVCWL